MAKMTKPIGTTMGGTNQEAMCDPSDVRREHTSLSRRRLGCHANDGQTLLHPSRFVHRETILRHGSESG